MLVANQVRLPIRSGEQDPERWNRICEMLDAALQLPPGERGRYLDRTCGGEALVRAEVESLLAASERSAWFDQPILSNPSSTATLELEGEGFRPGSLIGHYEIREKIGEGGMGAVYKARDRRLERDVAVKVISRFHDREWDERRFFQEAKAASALNHPNIVTIHEYDNADGMEYMVMEYIRGTTLDRVAETGVPREKLLDYACQVAGALAKAHEAGIVHRDLKPKNIMVTTDGVVKVLDFGLAKQMTPSSSDTQLTRAGTTMGTPAYMSPEQAKGEAIDHRSDIFSFGIILYELAYGRHPFEGADQLDTLYNIVHAETPTVARVDSSVPAKLAGVIGRCLKKDANERASSMAEVRTDLAALVEGPRLEAAPQPKSRAAFYIVLACIALVAAAGWWWLRPRPAAAPGPERLISYSIEAQKPGRSSYEASAKEVFSSGDKFRLRLESPQSGCLYLISEGPGDDGSEQLWILYPRPADGASLAAGTAVETGWYEFDANPGTERLLIVWAAKPIGAIERTRAGSKNGGVKQAPEVRGLQVFLAGVKEKCGTVVNESGNQSQLRAAGDVLEAEVMLRHN